MEFKSKFFNSKDIILNFFIFKQKKQKIHFENHIKSLKIHYFLHKNQLSYIISKNKIKINNKLKVSQNLSKKYEN